MKKSGLFYSYNTYYACDFVPVNPIIKYIVLNLVYSFIIMLRIIIGSVSSFLMVARPGDGTVPDAMHSTNQKQCSLSTIKKKKK